MRTAYLAALTAVGLLVPTPWLRAEPAPPASFDLAAATSAQAQAQAGVTVNPQGRNDPGAPDQDLDLRPQKPHEEEKHITETWWFWGAVAGVAVTTVAIVLIAGRPLEKPESDLGDMRAFRR